MDFLAKARHVIEIETGALQRMAARLDEGFPRAVTMLHETLDRRGKIVVVGIGKSGNIGHKIAATLNSTGATAVVLNSQNALHGDLGILSDGDAVLLLSYSGETPELLDLLPHIKRFEVGLIALTGKADSTLAEHSDVTLDTSVDREACPMNLAPTSSSTAMLVMGDALAMVLLEARGFTEKQFARFHPGGALGRRLLLRVEDVMRRGDDAPKVTADTPVALGLIEMSRKGLGMTVVVDAEDRAIGVYTDGDLRRSLDRRIDVHAARMHEVMTRPCRSIGPRELAAEAVHLMETHRITSLPVVDDDGRLVGALNVHDLLRAGVV